MRSWLPAALLSLALIEGSAGCNGPAAAGRDFLDPYRVVIGAGSGAGVRINQNGLFHTGLMFGVKPQALSLGWKYGEAYAFQPGSDLHMEVDQSLLYKTTSLFDYDYGTGDVKLARESLAVLPAVFSWVDSADGDAVSWEVPESGTRLSPQRYMWSPEALDKDRFAAVHAFDIEFEVMLIADIDVGYSPGEALDFFTSLFGYDLAKDDDR